MALFISLFLFFFFFGLMFNIECLYGCFVCVGDGVNHHLCLSWMINRGSLDDVQILVKTAPCRHKQ